MFKQTNLNLHSQTVSYLRQLPPMTSLFWLDSVGTCRTLFVSFISVRKPTQWVWCYYLNLIRWQNPLKFPPGGSLSGWHSCRLALIVN